jgi:uncharacterized SAM-binding protein YcdF (DUF218 family)
MLAAASAGSRSGYSARVFFFLSKVLDVFLSPYTWALLLFAAAVPWRDRRIDRRRSRRRRVYGAVGLLVLLVASSLPVSMMLLWSLEHATVSTYHDDVAYDAVVLLGGVVDEEVTAVSGQPSYNDNVERVIMTHRLLRDGKARFVIVSGGTEHPKYGATSEAKMLAQQLEDWGVAKDRIILEDRALNTRQNALYSQEIARARGFQRVLVVTSAFHMARAEECFAAVGMKIDTLAVDYRAHERAGGRLGDWLPRASSLAVTASVIREMLGRLVYRAQGYAKAAR